MAKRRNTHNRFAAQGESDFSPLAETTLYHRFEEPEDPTHWRRNAMLAMAGVGAVGLLFIYMIAR